MAAGGDLQTLLAMTDRNMGDFLFHGTDTDQVYAVYLVPWLPGVDLTDLVTPYSRPIPATVVPGITPAPTAILPCLQAKQGTSRLIIEEHPLKVGPMIPQVEGPYFETADGDTAEILAKNQCYHTGEALFGSFPANVGDQLLEIQGSGDMGDELRVILGNHLVYGTLTRPCAFTEPRGDWGYDEHWVMELGLPEQDSIFPTKGQIIQDGQELPLAYDEIPHYLCCSAGAMNPETFPNMVRFFGRRGEQWYYVEAYVPFDEAQEAALCPPTPTPAPTVTAVPTPLDNAVSPQAGAAQARQEDGMVMVYVQAGGFHMGSGWDPWDQGQQPQHTVYWISCFHRDGWGPDDYFAGFRCATPAGAGG